MKLKQLTAVLLLFSAYTSAAPPVVKEFQDWQVIDAQDKAFAITTNQQQLQFILEAIQLSPNYRTFLPYFDLYGLAGCNSQHKGARIDITMTVDTYSKTYPTICDGTLLMFDIITFLELVDSAKDTSPLTLTSPNFKGNISFSMKGSEESKNYMLQAQNNFNIN